MDQQQTFSEGFMRGWESIVGPALEPPEIEIPPAVPSGSRFMQGLIMGIEAGKKKMAELSEPHSAA
jgi:hypothetical protein